MSAEPGSLRWHLLREQFGTPTPQYRFSVADREAAKALRILQEDLLFTPEQHVDAEMDGAA